MLAVLIAFVGLLQVVTAQFHLSLDKSSYGAADSIKLSWSTSGSVLKLGDLTTGVVSLCTCNSTNTFGCKQVDNDVDLTGSSYSFSVASIASLGPDGDYMIQLTAINPKKKTEYAISYTSVWAEISGMSGSDDATSGCQVPTDTDNNVPGTGTATSSTISWTSWTLPASLQTISSYLIPYTFQVGPTRYAPFQSTPGTKVTKTTTPSRRAPTSSSSVFTTYLFYKYMQVTTLTPSPASPAIQHSNFAPPLNTTPSGYKPTRVFPTLAVSTISSTRAKRWADA